MIDKKRILIVDDDPDIQALLKKRLEFGGFACDSAFTIESALKKMGEENPNLVILDLGFSGADGTAFLKNVHQWLPKNHRAPSVIVLSGHHEQDIVEYVMDLGATAFLKKPFDPDVLLSMVNGYIH